jgi:hypothetical protein
VTSWFHQDTQIYPDEQQKIEEEACENLWQVPFLVNVPIALRTKISAISRKHLVKRAWSPAPGFQSLEQYRLVPITPFSESMTRKVFRPFIVGCGVSESKPPHDDFPKKK